MFNAIVMSGLFAILLMTQHPDPQWYHWLLVPGAFILALCTGHKGHGGDGGGGSGGGGC